MNYLYDSSAILNTVRTHGRHAYGLLKGGLTLSLARYEIGNALWKEALLHKRISLQEALEAVVLLGKVLEVMRVVEPSDAGTVLTLAYELQTTFYDASYIVAAAENGAKLVTDDEGLARKVKSDDATIAKMLGKRVEVLSSSEITRKV